MCDIFNTLDLNPSTRSFSGTVPLTGVAGQFSLGQLWNPATSTVNLIVTEITWLDPFTNLNNFTFSFYNAAITNLFASGPFSKIANSSAISSSELRFDNSGLGPPGSLLKVSNLQLATSVSPYTINPGRGIVLTSGVVNITGNVTFDFYEKSF